MIPRPDATHSPKLASWVESANAPGCDFPIQNLPFGMFRPKGEKKPRAKAKKKAPAKKKKSTKKASK